MSFKYEIQTWCYSGLCSWVKAASHFLPKPATAIWSLSWSALGSSRPSCQSLDFWDTDGKTIDGVQPVRNSKEIEKEKKTMKSNYMDLHLKQKLIEFCPKCLVVSCARNYCAGPAGSVLQNWIALHPPFMVHFTYLMQSEKPQKEQVWRGNKGFFLPCFVFKFLWIEAFVFTRCSKSQRNKSSRVVRWRHFSLSLWKQDTKSSFVCFLFCLTRHEVTWRITTMPVNGLNHLEFHTSSS